MARNWAEDYSNAEEVLFNKGKWSVKKDGEGTLSLYFDEKYKGISDCNKYKLLPKGFLLFSDKGICNSFYLYLEDTDSPIFSLLAKEAKMEIDNDFISFYESKEDINPTIFSKDSLNKVNLTDNNQIGLNL